MAKESGRGWAQVVGGACQRLREEFGGASGDEIAEAMMRNFGLGPALAYRAAHGWSQQRAVDRYNEVEGSGRAPMTKQRLSEYEHWPDPGRRRPSLGVLTLLAAAYGTHPTRLLDDAGRARFSAGEQRLLDLLDTGRVHADVSPVGPPASPPTLVGAPEQR